MKTQIFPNFSTKKDLIGKEHRETNTFSISEEKKGARSLKDAMLYIGKQENFGYTKIPLTTIEYRDCCIDLLHLLLRITDQLEDLLLELIDAYG